jgi:stage II sporulation protein D
MSLHRSFAALVTLAAVVSVACGASGPSGASAASSASSAPVDESYPVPTGRTITFHGHGFGHGHGMSQYGAYGAARRGLSYREILGFYYPGTSWGTVHRWVRVLVTADTTSDLVVSPASGLRVRDLGSGVLYRLPAIAGVRRWRLNVDGGRSVLGYLTSEWHRYRPGGHAALVGDGQFNADVPLRLWTPYGSRSYRGVLRAVAPGPGSAVRDTVNVVSLDGYVRGVVASEMPVSWSMEAVKAQAVAARTYATWSRNENLDRYWHICDTTACQVYGGLDAEQPRGNAAVTATARQILTYGGTAAFTQFSASSGGWLSAGSRPYLVAKPDPYDGFSANPVHDWTLRLDAARIERAYPRIGRLQRLLVTRRDGHGQWGGRVVTLVLDGRRANATLSGDAFRSAFGLRSSWFIPR